MLDVTGLMGKVQVAGPRVVAVDPVGRDGLFHQGEGIEGGAIELPPTVAIALEQLDGTELETRMDHAAVAAAGARSELVLLEQGDRAAAPGQPRRGHRSGVAAAHDDDIDLRRKRGRGSCARRGFAPPVGLLAVARSERCYASTLTSCQKAT